MIPINGMMNHIAEMAHAETFFTKHISTRAAVLIGAFPLELCASFENAIKLPFQAGLAVVKLTCKPINLCLDSQSIKNFTDKQPGSIDLLKTTLKVIGYAVGAFVTLSFGLLRPYDNFKLHAALHLIRDEKALAEMKAAELKAANEKQEQEKAMQTHIENLLLIMRQKALEREALLAAELRKCQEATAETSLEGEKTSVAKLEDKDYKNFINTEFKKRLIQEHHRIISTQKK